jgi:hypothetical protein
MTPKEQNLEFIKPNAIIENEQVVLYFQFDDNEPIEALKCNGNKFTMEILHIENSFVTFTDGEKTMKLFVRRCYQETFKKD